MHRICLYYIKPLRITVTNNTTVSRWRLKYAKKIDFAFLNANKLFSLTQTVSNQLNYCFWQKRNKCGARQKQQQVKQAREQY